MTELRRARRRRRLHRAHRRAGRQRPRRCAKTSTYLRKLWQHVRETALRPPAGDLRARGPAAAAAHAARRARARRRAACWSTRRATHDAHARVRRAVHARARPSASSTTPAQRPIFDLYGVEEEISKALERKVPLKSGGYLVIDQTEAMTTIDVNTGAFVGHAQPRGDDLPHQPRGGGGDRAAAAAAQPRRHHHHRLHRHEGRGAPAPGAARARASAGRATTPRRTS